MCLEHPHEPLEVLSQYEILNDSVELLPDRLPQVGKSGLLARNLGTVRFSSA
jgi:hypothetical protein